MVRWQSSQGCVVMKCFGGLPVAVIPLWQVTQAAVMRVWSIRAPAKLTVLLWQVSHGAVVAMCLAGLPSAVVPLWHVAQPLRMPVWFIRAPAKVTVLL
jgi:hypothetical protein